MLGWALVTTFTGLVENFAGLLVTRGFLGLVQGGVFPGLVYLYVLFHHSDERVSQFTSNRYITVSPCGIKATNVASALPCSIRSP